MACGGARMSAAAAAAGMVRMIAPWIIACSFLLFSSSLPGEFNRRSVHLYFKFFCLISSVYDEYISCQQFNSSVFFACRVSSVDAMISSPVLSSVVFSLHVTRLSFFGHVCPNLFLILINYHCHFVHRLSLNV